jgi:hypothetical protein
MRIAYITFATHMTAHEHVCDHVRVHVHTRLLIKPVDFTGITAFEEEASLLLELGKLDHPAMQA